MKYCEHIAHTIAFNKNEILPCCTLNADFVPPYFNSKLEAHNAVTTLDIEAKQQAMMTLINSNAIEKYPCKNCLFCKEVEQMPEDGNKINLIFLRQWTRDDSYDENYSLPMNYDAYDLIKKLYETGKIDKENLTVKMLSYDLSTVTDLDKYLELFKNNGVHAVHISTDKLAFNQTIANMLPEEKASINISLDAGTEETYKKLKNNDNFAINIENLKKYNEYKKENDYALCIHYVLYKDINDNKKEIDSFLNLMKETGVTNIGIRINGDHMKNILSNREGNLANYKTLITYFYEEANKNNFHIDNDSCIEQNFVLEHKKAKKGFFSWLFD